TTTPGPAGGGAAMGAARRPWGAHLGRPAPPSAARQSRRAYIPAVADLHRTKALLELVRAAKADGAVIAALHESGSARFAALPFAEATAIVLVVGPEGGLDDAELAALAEAGAEVTLLGPTVLRTSTAAAVALGALGALTPRW
uniref:RsmE family RNA methyltransferase n=1 Tax=Nocardia abscessus TaxID=120957 RepID=UPI0024573D90